MGVHGIERQEVYSDLVQMAVATIDILGLVQ